MATILRPIESRPTSPLFAGPLPAGTSPLERQSFRQTGSIIRPIKTGLILAPAEPKRGRLQIFEANKLRKIPFIGNIVEFLIGPEDAIVQAFEPEDIDIISFVRNRGIIRSIYQGATKTDQKKVNDRYVNLIRDVGIDPLRATQLATQDVFKDAGQTVQPTEDEQKVLSRARLFERAEIGLEALDILGFTGIIRRGGVILGKKVLKELAESASETTVRRIIQNQIPKAPTSLVDDIVRRVTPIKDKNTINKIVQEEISNFGKVGAVRPAARLVDEIPIKLRPLAIEARKFNTVEGFVEKVHTVPIESLTTPVTREEIIKRLGKIESRTPEDPVIVEITDEGTLNILDGVQRFFQKIDAGAKDIKIRFTPQNEKQLTDFFNQAKGAVTRPVRIPPREISGINTPIVFKLAEGDPILQINKEIASIRGERLAGTIDATTANKRVSELNARRVEEARAAGIAIIDGVPVIRKSGVFAPKEFVTHDFRDIGGITGGKSFNLDDAALAIDNKTFKEIAQTGLGPMSEIQILKSQSTTRLHNFGPEQADKVVTILKKHDVPIDETSGIQATLVAHGLTNELITAKGARNAISSVLSGVDIAPEAIEQALRTGFRQRIRGKESKLIEAVKDGIPENVVNMFQADLRPHFNKLRDDANVVRKSLGKDEIPFRQNYGPVMQQTDFWSKVRSDPKTTITDNFDFIIPNAKKNPHALMREGGAKDLEWNMWELLPRYHEAIAQDIFHTPIIEQLKAVNKVFQARGMSNMANFLNRNIRENIVGQPDQLDFFFKFILRPKVATTLKAINRARTTAALSFNIVWTAAVQTASQALTLARSTAGTVGPVGIVYGPLDMAKGYFKFFTSSARRTQVNNLPTISTKTAGKSIGSTGFGDLDILGGKIISTKWDTFNQFLAKFADTMEYGLTGAASSTGYEMAARHGAKGKEADFLADWMGGATQSRYNREARPLFRNSLLVRSMFPFNTYLFELYRLNKTIVGAPGGMPLGGFERINTAILLLGGMYLYDRYVVEPVTGRRLLRPSVFFPISGDEIEVMMNEGVEASGLADKEIPVVTPVLDRLGLGEPDVGFKPTGALYREGIGVIKAMDAYVRYGNIQPLRKEMIKWGFGFTGAAGASTLNRFIDGLITNATGFQTNRAGEELFRIEGIDRYTSPLIGPYATRAGIEYKQEGGSIVVQDARQEKKRMESLPREQAKLEFDILADQFPALARQVRILFEDEANPILKEVRGLGIKNGMRAERIVEELEKIDADKRAEEYEKLREAGVITKEVSGQVTKILEEQANAVQGVLPSIKDTIWSDKALIRTIALYAAALQIDPFTAFDRMLGGERIIRITNGAIITETLSLEESQRIRRERAAELGISPEELSSDWRLDHTISKKLGGSDKESNLILVSKQEWESYTPIELHLINLLKAEKISKKDAQRLIKEFKEGKIPASDITSL